MKHTRVPRTICKEVRRLAIEHLRYLAFTFFEAESGIISQVESKTGKKRNGPNRKSNRLTNKKKYTYLNCVIIAWVDWCGARFALATNLLTIIEGVIQFAARYFRADESAWRKLCTNVNQPHLIWATVLYRQVPPTRSKDTRTNNPIDQGVDMYLSPRRCCCCRWLGVAPIKMKSGRPIKIRILNISSCLN